MTLTYQEARNIVANRMKEVKGYDDKALTQMQAYFDIIIDLYKAENEEAIKYAASMEDK